MEKTIRATEAVRHFSEILNTIRFKGEHYIIQRGGIAVAFMGPLEEARRERLCGEIKTLFERLPRLGKEAEALEKDLEEILMHQPTLPVSGPWE